MIVDLKKYKGEFDSYIDLMEPFIDKASWGEVRQLQASLATIIERKPPTFRWETPRQRPIKTVVTESYDRPGVKMPALRVSIGICATGSKQKCGSQKSVDYRFCELMTHIDILQDGAEGATLLQLHVDQKNEKQIGPAIHIQIREDYVKDVRGVPLAVPRIPYGFVLPTDGFDFVLSEFFGADWQKVQNGAKAIVSMRQAQLERAKRITTEIHQSWMRFPKRTLVSVLQDCSFPDLRLA